MKAVIWDVSLKDGTKTFARVMQRALDADVISKHGRCKSPDELAEKLSQYDMILMSCAQWHDDEKRTQEASWILRIAERLGDRMIATIHNSLDPAAPDFPPSAPNLPAIIRACAVTWTHRAEQLANTSPNKVVAWPYLPFYPSTDLYEQSDVEASGLWSTSRIVKWKRVDLPILAGYRGRYFVAGKGHFFAAPKLRGQLVALGGNDTGEHQRTWQSPWRVLWPEGGGVDYIGGYAEPSDLPWHWATMHFSYQEKRHLEYSTLEAMDHGRRCLVPWKNAKDLGYSTIEFYAQDHLLTAINHADTRGLPSPTAIQADLAKHDPAILVKKLEEALHNS